MGNRQPVGSPVCDSGKSHQMEDSEKAMKRACSVCSHMLEGARRRRPRGLANDPKWNACSADLEPAQNVSLKIERTACMAGNSE